MNKFRFYFVFILAFFLLSLPVFAASDTYYVKQWYIPKIHADDVWKVTRGDDSIIVAVIDTGVDIDHPDLEKNIWINKKEIAGDKKDNDRNGYVDDINGWDFVENEANPEPNIGSSYTREGVSHGTFLAGIIGAVHDNGKGIKGIAGKVKIMALAALSPNGVGNSSDVSDAVDYAVDNGADIINLSFGGNQYSSDLKRSIENAYAKGVLVVAAAGNEGAGSGEGADLTNNPVYPICYDQDSSINRVLGVLATDKKNKVTGFSNYGKGCIDIGAPGIDMTSLGYYDANKSSFKSYYLHGWNGSSFASAVVSGGAALLKSIDKNLSPKEMIKVITQNADNIFISTKHKGKAGEGVLNVWKAMNALENDLLKVDPVGDDSDSSSNNSRQTNRTPNTSTTKTLNGTESSLYVTSKSGWKGNVRLLNSTFKDVRQFEVFGGDNYKGVNIQLVNVDSDSAKEIVAGAVVGNSPFVRVLEPNGLMLSSFLAFDGSFKGGVQAAVGDLNGNGSKEIVVVADSKFAPVVRIFNFSGKLIGQFYAYNSTYTNGLNLVVGDIDKDGKDEIIVSPNEGLMPKVKVFDDKGNLERSYLPYSASFTGGVNIALADLDGNGQLDLITGAGPGGGAHVQAFKYTGERLVSFMAYSSNFRGGVEVAGGDFDGDGSSDIVTVPQSMGGPHIKVFTRSGSMRYEFFPWSVNFRGGINIALDD